MTIGVRFVVIKHEGCQDCPACTRMQEMYGTCEYVGGTDRCECASIEYRKNLGNRTKNEQGILQTGSTDAVRYRYWKRWLQDQKE